MRGLGDWIWSGLASGFGHAPDWWLAWLTVVLVLTAGASVLFVARQLRHLVREGKIASGAATSQLHDHVREGMWHVNQMFLEHPDLYQYFVEGIPVPKDAEDRIQVHVEQVAEALLELAENVVEQRSTLETDLDWSTWDAYFRYLYTASPRIRQYIPDNVDFYPDYVFAIFGFVNVRESASGRLLSQWEAYELKPRGFEIFTPLADLEDELRSPSGRQLARQVFGFEHPAEGGYPWMRTWMMRRLDERRPDSLTAMLAEVEADVRRRKLQVQLHKNQVDPDSERWLRSWLLGVMEPSELRRVEMAVVGEAGPPARYDLDARGRRGNRFRIKEYAPRGTRQRRRAGSGAGVLPQARPASRSQPG